MNNYNTAFMGRGKISVFQKFSYWIYHLQFDSDLISKLNELKDS